MPRGRRAAVVGQGVGSSDAGQKGSEGFSCNVKKNSKRSISGCGSQGEERGGFANAPDTGGQ